MTTGCTSLLVFFLFALPFHSFRVTFATLLARAGVHPKVAQRLLRHQDIKMTMNIYTKVDIEDLDTALDSLPTPKMSAHSPQFVRDPGPDLASWGKKRTTG